MELLYFLAGMILIMVFWSFFTVSLLVLYKRSQSKDKAKWLYWSTFILLVASTVMWILPEFMYSERYDEQLIQNDDIVESVDLLAQ